MGHYGDVFVALFSAQLGRPNRSGSAELAIAGELHLLFSTFLVGAL